jgi:hypothetical protein
VKRRSTALALVHHPVLDRRGDRVTSAVTNLDLHDIARVSKTYGLDRFYVVTPAQEQRRIVERIVGHWTTGFGADYNRHRRDALSLIEIVSSLEEAMEEMQRLTGEEPLPVLTGASRQGLSFSECRKLASERDLLLVLGTGWGLDPTFFSKGWPVLSAIRGGGEYNHLSVRSAAAIIADRLFGCEDDAPVQAPVV